MQDYYNQLDEFLRPYEWNLNLPRFVTEFFGHDRTWLAGVLKAVLPAGRLTDEEINDATYALWGYSQHHRLNIDVGVTPTEELDAEEHRLTE